MIQLGQPHWIRGNEANRMPRCHIVIDTEARSVKANGATIQSWLCGVASHDHEHHKGAGRRPTEWGGFRDPLAMWEWITARCQSGRRTILVAHNLGYDLRISQAFRHLPELGWTLSGIALDGRGAWAIWRQDERTLVMVDSMSWLNVGLAHVAPLVGFPKPPLPELSTVTAEVAARCVADVEILRRAWLRIMDWLEAEDMGNWRITGSGMAWAAWRHRWYTHKVLVHGDDALRAVERTAAWTGRCEAWRHGRQGAGPFTEHDFAHAYASIARDCGIPSRYSSHVVAPELARVLDWGTRRGVLTRAVVRSEVPTLPARTPEGIAWPVGTFETVVWEPELALAVEHGAEVRPLESWVYDRTPAMAAWGAWVCEMLDAETGAINPVIRLVAKHWARALIGRTAVRHTTWRPWGAWDTQEARVFDVCGPAAEGVKRLLVVGGAAYADEGESEGADAIPQVMSHIMSNARVRLWRAMETAGFENVSYVDTDSLIVNAAGNERLLAAAIPDLRVKAIYRKLEIMGPRQLIVDGSLRAAGVPTKAVRIAPELWEGTVWRQLGQSIAMGEHDAVVLKDRRIRVAGTDNRRQHVSRGRTEPRCLAV